MSVLMRGAAGDSATGRFEAWEQEICRTFVPLQARQLSNARRFCGSVRSQLFGSVVLSEVSGDDVVVDRTPPLIRRGDPEYIKVGVQRRGLSVIEQDGRQAILRSGGVVMYDTSRPYRIVMGSESSMTVAMMPVALLRPDRERIASMTASALDMPSGPSALLSMFLVRLHREDCGGDPATASHLGDAVADMVAAVIGERASGRDQAAIGGDTAILRSAAYRYIDEHLNEPGLRTVAIAAALYVSSRRLQRAFAEVNVQVSGYIRTRRLERCRRDLRDPTLAHRTIAGIGARWGFHDPARFSKIFREEFGCSPRECRVSARTEENVAGVGA